jgi:hypothetical protein
VEAKEDDTRDDESDAVDEDEPILGGYGGVSNMRLRLCLARRARRREAAVEPLPPGTLTPFAFTSSSSSSSYFKKIIS